MITLEGIPEPLNRGRDEKPDVLIGGDVSQPIFDILSKLMDPNYE